MIDGSLQLTWRLLLETNSLRTESNKLDSKLVEIRLSMTHPINVNKVFILLEGSTDIKLFRKFFAKEYTDTTGLDGKEKVVEALEKLISEGYTKIIGIKDADFDNILTRPNIDNLFITDLHDMEIQMINSSSLDSLVAEYGSSDINTLDIKTQVYDSALIIGYARLFNEKKKLEYGERDLSFDSLTFQNFIAINSKELILDKNKFFLELIDESKKRKPTIQITNEELESEINNLKAQFTDKYQICSGHDVTKLIGFILLKNPNGNEIEKSLRLSYPFEDFKNTQLYKDLLAWQNLNGISLFS